MSAATRVLLLLALASCVPQTPSRTQPVATAPEPAASTPPPFASAPSPLIEEPLPRDGLLSARRIDAVPGRPISTEHPQGTLFLALWLQDSDPERSGARLIEWDLARSRPLRVARVGGSPSTEIRLVAERDTWHLLVHAAAGVKLLELDASWTVRGSLALPVDADLDGLQLALDADHVIVAGTLRAAPEGPSLRVCSFARRTGSPVSRRDFWPPAMERSLALRAIAVRHGKVFVAAQRDEGSAASGSSMKRGPRGPLVVYRFAPADPTQSAHVTIPTGATFDFASLLAYEDGFAVLTPSRCNRVQPDVLTTRSCNLHVLAATPRALGLDDDGLSAPCLSVEAFGARHQVCAVQHASGPPVLRILAAPHPRSVK